MKSIRITVLTVAFAGLFSPLVHAAVSVADAAATCRAEAQARYANGDRQARVKFKGMFGGADVRKVRMQVLPPEGKAFLVVCEVSGRSGDFLGLAPVGEAAGDAVAQTQGAAR